ncbi:MAG: amino acid adenylation domain-containing protein, partial [Chloroflexi bacterium]|nr:amino acid adenylation domain-containing protein [Chloroflexota bacterium]
HITSQDQIVNGRYLHTLFEYQVAQNPNRTALIFNETTLSYGALNQKANQLAHYLQKHGIGPEVTVGIYMERDINLIVSLLAVLKAGGAYVPLDPNYPAERVAFMLADGAAPLLLSQERLRHKLPTNHIQTIFVDSEWDSLIANEPLLNLTVPAQPDNLAYLIYTSGSTGKPKGVAIRHCNAVALIEWAATVFTPEELSGMLAVTSICFDISIFELFLPLAAGGTIILAENALHLLSLPARDQVKLINTVPSAIAELVKVNGIPDATITVNLAGEPLSRALVDRVYAQGKNVQRVYNLYGPSEDTTYSTYTLVHKDVQDEPTIGRPISGTFGYVLDQNGQAVPAGEMGELYLGGTGVARGYLNRPTLTAARFIANPFGDGVLYKTGDLVHAGPNGEWMYHGRIDHQVKIRGFRIELGEIEAALSQHDNIFSQTVMVYEENPGEKQLVAYFVPNRTPLPTVTELRRHLQKTLPDYMIPTAFVPMPEMPLTPNGKIDRKALPLPNQHRPDLETAFVSPRNPTEAAIVAAWQDVLQRDQVGVFDNFFELGGHSLMATQVLARIAVDDISLTQADFFAAPTVAGLAELVHTKKEGAAHTPLVASWEREGKR